MASRHAMNVARNERRYGWLLSRGVLTYPDDARARAQAEAVECPVCGRLVHPTNMKRHNELYHVAETQRAETQLRPYGVPGVPLLCAVNPGSPLAVPVVAAPAKVVQMPMPQMIVNKAKVSLIAMMATVLVDAAVDGDYAEVDKALAEIQHELYRACGRDDALRAEYKAEIRKELYCSEILETLESVA